MKRFFIEKLKSWKNSSHRKPLILRGARQTGKTYILQAFGQKEYQDVIYVNFERQQDIASFFSASLAPTDILRYLGIYFDKQIQPGSTLIIFDEIQACPEALNSLKYFCEEAPEYHVVAAGSLLGVKLAQIKGFPVGKVEFMTLYPFSFEEFLLALGHETLMSYIQNFKKNDAIPLALHKKLLGLLKQYFIIGGMPEAIAYYIETEDYYKVRKVQEDILDAYELDFSKYANASENMKITEVWHNIPKQLSKENKKFIFSTIKKSARGREYIAAIQWLFDAGLIHKVNHIETAKLPLSAYSNSDHFKVYMLDIGLLAALANLSHKTILDNDQLFVEFKGALAENYVVQQLITHHEASLFYWSSAGQAEVDIVMQKDSDIYPLEVKAGISTKNKSLLVYDKKFNPAVLSRTNQREFHQGNNLVNYPLYLIAKFPGGC